jgi:hypothetical protein
MGLAIVLSFALCSAPQPPSPKQLKQLKQIESAKHMKTSDWVMIGTAASLLAYDIYISTQPKQPTISTRLNTRSRQFPAIPFAIGLLMGHLFFSF